MNTQVGTRVVAVLNADKDTVWAFGEGTLVGDRRYGGGITEAEMERCRRAIRKSDEMKELMDPEAIYGQLVAEGKVTAAVAAVRVAAASLAIAESQARPLDDRARDLAESMRMNPQIELDSGGVAWGCECWWWPVEEKTLADFAAGRTIVVIGQKTPAGTS